MNASLTALAQTARSRGQMRGVRSLARTGAPHNTRWYIHVCILMYVHIYVCMYVYMHLCVYVLYDIYICTYVHDMYICMYVRVYAFVRICVV